MGRPRRDRSSTHVQRLNVQELVGIPVLQSVVLARREEQMRLGNELNGGDRVVVREERSVAVAEVQSPDFDVAIARTGDHQTAVRGDVQAKNRLRVTVQRQKHLQGSGEHRST